MQRAVPAPEQEPVRRAQRHCPGPVAARADACRERGAEVTTVAALYVAERGCYTDLPGVDAWTEARDYAGPWPVVAHPPCARWGAYWHGGPRYPHTKKLGDDGGCFPAALGAVRKWGGVLEHPAGSRAWAAFNLKAPRASGWSVADAHGGWTCRVEQGAYGHRARKATWLYACGVDLPPLKWEPLKGETRQHADIERAAARAGSSARRRASRGGNGRSGARGSWLSPRPTQRGAAPN